MINKGDFHTWLKNDGYRVYFVRISNTAIFDYEKGSVHTDLALNYLRGNITHETVINGLINTGYFRDCVDLGEMKIEDSYPTPNDRNLCLRFENHHLLPLNRVLGLMIFPIKLPAEQEAKDFLNFYKTMVDLVKDDTLDVDFSRSDL